MRDGSETVADLTELHARGKDVACAACDDNSGDQWRAASPQYSFPCAWSTLFAPKDNSDQWWLRQHPGEVARLGFYVFDTEDWGIVLGIDAAGFDFVEAFWEPLYKLRGLEWQQAA